MKIIDANVGELTNFEVMDFLNLRGASKDPLRVAALISPSEYKVYDYLITTPACNQSRQLIHDFHISCKSYKLAKAEILNIINSRPSQQVEIYTMIEQAEDRFDTIEQLDELVQMIKQMLPPCPSEMMTEAEIGDNREQNDDG